jgi:hypothetical protein
LRPCIGRPQKFRTFANGVRQVPAHGMSAVRKNDQLPIGDFGDNQLCSLAVPNRSSSALIAGGHVEVQVVKKYSFHYVMCQHPVPSLVENAERFGNY